MLWLSFPLGVLVALAAGAGLFWPPTYARETALWAAEGHGGDAVILFVIVPILLASAVSAHRGSVSAWPVGIFVAAAAGFSVLLVRFLRA